MAPFTERTPRVVSAVKLHRAAERRRQGLFLAEGINAVSAALESTAERRAREDAQPVCVEVFCTREAADRYPDIADRADGAGVPMRIVTARAAHRLAETVTDQGVFAVCRLLEEPLDKVVAGRHPAGPGTAQAVPDVVAVAVSVSDPGNAGTVLRIADAMGVAGVVFAGECVDPHNGKSVRSSAGSIFHVPFARERDTARALALLRSRGFQLLATAADGAVDLDGADELLAAPTAWLFGNEAHGLDAESAAGADHSVQIPIAGRAESLNLATAAAICLHASARARRRSRWDRA